VLTCGGVVGADELLQMGSSSRKSSRGLAVLEEGRDVQS